MEWGEVVLVREFVAARVESIVIECPEKCFLFGIADARSE